MPRSWNCSRVAMMPLGADVPFVLGDDELGSLADDRLEGGVVVGESLDARVRFGELGEHVGEPDAGADDLVGEAEGIEDLGRRLAERDGARRRLVEGYLDTAVVEGQRESRSIGQRSVSRLLKKCLGWL